MQPSRIEIDISRQRLQLIRGEEMIFSCDVSTALAGTGTEMGSLRTPLGRFSIAEKIGHGMPAGTVFRSRVPTGEVIDPLSPDDQIATRILWLEGRDLENANTKDRYIYLHGTNHEEELGFPTSHGCVRLGNEAIRELFDLVDLSTEVVIRE